MKIRPQEVAERRDDDDLFIIDVRTVEGYRKWAVRGSYNLPICDELRHLDFTGLEGYLDEIPSSTEIAIICATGNTSAYAAEFLREQGYKARSVTDGMRGWGRIHRIYDVDTTRGVMQVVRPGTGCISYFIVDAGEAFIVDPSQYVNRYRDYANELDVEIKGTIDTHIHADHISGGRVLANEFDVPYYLHGANTGSLKNCSSLKDNDILSVGSRELEVIHTPGHTPGSVSLHFGNVLLSGDTLFLRSVGRPDLEDSSEKAIRKAASNLFSSLTHLHVLPKNTVVLPGHFSNEVNEVDRPLSTTLRNLATENELFGMAKNGSESAFIESILGTLSDTPNNYHQIKSTNQGNEAVIDDMEVIELGSNNCAAN